MRDVEVTADGARMRWIELPGREPPRVYLHGLGCMAAASFAHIARHPALSERRSLLVDLLGFGLSDRPAGFDYTLERHAGAVATALDAAQVSRADVIAHSMGGAVAILLAVRRPDLVARLILAESNLDPLVPDAFSTRCAAYREEEFLASGHADLIADTAAEWRATLRLADPTALYRTAVSLASASTLRAALAALAIPRAFLIGEESGPLDGADELAAAGVTLETIPRAGHSMMFDNPDGFAEAIARASLQA